MSHQHGVNALTAQRRGRAAWLFAMDPTSLEEIIRQVECIIANEFRAKVRPYGIVGEKFTNWVEDMTTEGLCVAEERSEKYDSDRSPVWNWVAMKARDCAKKWIANLKKDLTNLHRPSGDTTAASSIPRSVSSDGGGPMRFIDVRISVEQMLETELSTAQQRMLKAFRGGCTVQEIAEREGRSEKTTRRYIDRIRERLRQVAPLYDIHAPSRESPRAREPSRRRTKSSFNIESVPVAGDNPND